VTYSTADARRQLLDQVAAASEELGVALADLTEAYEQLDDATADRLEESLFRPVQTAFGRSKRAHAEFAARHDLPGRTIAPATRGLPSHGVRGFVESAVQAVGRADMTLGTLQDSMLPVEVGDAELRAALSEVRRLVGDVPARARGFVRVLGR
jgi:hypothetical protein